MSSAVGPKPSTQADKKSELTTDVYQGVAKVSSEGYTSFRMRRDVKRKFEKIADEKNLAFAGPLIHNILEKWLEENHPNIQ